ncbi:hypothetical protein XU18_0064 [Perkinsela sp. CCAP 1560/4]|nr:hypothetical protein XU18_0064 [Perkinsela sp. CCAP 1560/4]|eukprot:KNH09379.1 hypothetical protein XU18_0064 [Perkinsela sp. CCAP 1560/4]
MCGRAACNCGADSIFRSARALRSFHPQGASHANASDTEVGHCPNNEIAWKNSASFAPYETNIRPGDYLTVLHAKDVSSNVTSEPMEIEIATVKWGIHAQFSHLVINARSETVAKSKYFQTFAGRRCIICVTGYMEWFSPIKTNCTKQPFYFYKKHSSTPSDPPLTWLAGIWDGSDHCVILTTNACDDVKWCHSRMPALLTSNNDAWNWINPSKSFADGLRLLHSSNDFLGWHKIRPDFARHFDQVKKECASIQTYDDQKGFTKKRMESTQILAPYAPVTLDKYFGSKKFKSGSLETMKKEAEYP